ncbi:hypothetical protein PAHAL_3G050400 [Panicum hallii]|uniref:Uncharacterized protein n=1 Tax=Panicum hallii TaxID=206008 RepID=A0A2S3H671_9POAL|nr:hypothetical protein PAHAL_3G050400 [Panicum hallii]
MSLLYNVHNSWYCSLHSDLQKFMLRYRFRKSCLDTHFEGTISFLCHLLLVGSFLI